MLRRVPCKNKRVESGLVHIAGGVDYNGGGLIYHGERFFYPDPLLNIFF